jgi:hypothetical protein
MTGVINMNLISKIATAGAVAAMGLGLGAAGASANITLDYDNAIAPGGQFTGTQTTQNVFTAGGSSVECDGATFTGNVSNSSTNTIPFHAEYSGCTVDFGLFTAGATVVTNSDWDLTATSGSAGTSVTADANIFAPASGPAVTITVAGICTISIAAQGPLSHVVATNVASPTGVDIDATVSGIAFTSSGLCPGVPASGTNATYVGGVNIPGITMTGSF